MTAANCTAVHQATLATELRNTPVNNPQPADATATCPAGTTLRTLFDSESGTPATQVHGRRRLVAQRHRRLGPGRAQQRRTRGPTPSPARSGEPR